MQFPATPAFSSSRPRCSASSTTREASSVAGSLSPETSSIASIAPSPRTSPTCGQRCCQPSMRARIVSPIAADAGDEALVLDHVEHRDRSSLRDRVADVGAADAARLPAHP